MEAVSSNNCLQAVASSQRRLWHQERVSFKMGQMSNLDKGQGGGWATSWVGAGPGSKGGSRGVRGHCVSVRVTQGAPQPQPGRILPSLPRGLSHTLRVTHP